MTIFQIDDFVIINRGSNTSHDDHIPDFVTIDTGINLAGNVTNDEGAFIGIGSSIREKIHISAWSVIGGGAFVKNDISPNTMYAGVPGQIKKHL